MHFKFHQSLLIGSLAMTLDGHHVTDRHAENYVLLTSAAYNGNMNNSVLDHGYQLLFYQFLSYTGKHACKCCTKFEYNLYFPSHL